ncbi:MAG: hypothetical protein GYB68_09485 [Chloroflexi bacterium]|nr:hypothetical protein [Chloroflexota bacterium]
MHPPKRPIALASLAGVILLTALGFFAGAHPGLGSAPPLPVSAPASQLPLTNYFEITPLSGDDAASGGTACTFRDALRLANTDATVGGLGCTVVPVGSPSIAAGSPFVIRILPTAITYTLNGTQLEINNQGGDNRIFVTASSAGGPTLQAAASPGISTHRVLAVFSPAEIIGITIQNGTCTGACFNRPNQGGGIVNTSQLVLENVTLAGNQANTGGAIFNETTGELILNDVSIVNNLATNVGGGGIANQGELLILQSDFSNNVSNQFGGAIANEGNLEVTDSSFLNNQADIGGGAIGFDSGTGRIDAVTFNNNTADSGGGIYAVRGSSFELIDAFFSGNSALATSGGAIDSINSDLSMSASIFNGNQANTDGGALALSGGNATISGSRFSFNTAGNTFGGALGGGALWLLPTNSVQISDSSFNNNQSSSGGAIYAGSGEIIVLASNLISNEANSEGGAIFNRAILRVEDSEFDNNSSGSSGGAIRSLSSLNVDASTFTENVSSGSGGALALSSNATLSNSTLHENSGRFGGGLAADAGAIRLTHLTINENSASQQGGGLFNSGGSVAAANTILSNNRASSGPDCSGFFITSGVNLVTRRVGCSASGPIPIIADPNLGGLADNGGPTRTLLPAATSPAIDAADNGLCPTVDQRGVPRPIDYDSDGVATCDIGAVEREAEADLAITRITVTPDPAFVGDVLRYTIELTNRGSVAGRPTAILAQTLGTTPVIQVFGGIFSSCSINGGVGQCLYAAGSPDWEPGFTTNIQVLVQGPATPGDVIATALLEVDQGVSPIDPDLSNNTLSVTTPILDFTGATPTSTFTPQPTATFTPAPTSTSVPNTPVATLPPILPGATVTGTLLPTSTATLLIPTGTATQALASPTFPATVTPDDLGQPTDEATLDPTQVAEITPTQTATATLVDPLTGTATASPTPTTTPDIESITDLLVPLSVGCRIVPIAEIAPEVVDAYMMEVDPYLAPLWIICDEPPQQVALPVDPALGEALSGGGSIFLFDCQTEACRSFQSVSRAQDQLIFRAGVLTGRPNCAQGCTFANVGSQTVLVRSVIPVVLILFILGILLWLFVLLAARRRRDEDTEEDFTPGEDLAGGGADSGQ